MRRRIEFTSTGAFDFLNENTDDSHTITVELLGPAQRKPTGTGL